MLERPTTLRRAFVAGLKLVLAGTTIFAIGWGMLVMQPETDEPVANAEADITMFGFAPKSDQAIFADTMAQEGMEEPRAYDHNGNKLFFSTVTTNESPRQVLERFQRAFVENGLNENVHLSPPPEPPRNPRSLDIDDPAVRAELEKDNVPRKKWANDYYGGVVPFQVTADTVAMAGVTTPEGSEDMDAYLSEVFTAKKEGRLDGLGDSVQAMRYMDVVREGAGSRVTAIWSDEEYDPKKIANVGDPGEDLGVDPSIPVCPGCERLMHFKGETEEDYDNHAFRGPAHSKQQVLGFYRRTLPEKGWELSAADAVMRWAEVEGLKEPSEAEMLNFSRGGQFLTVVVWENEGSTSVHVARSN